MQSVGLARAARMLSNMRRYCLSPSAVTNRSRSAIIAASMRSSMRAWVSPQLRADRCSRPPSTGIVGRAVAAMQAVGIERLVDQQRARHHLRHDDDVEIHVQAEDLVVGREDEVDQRAAEHHRRGARPRPSGPAAWCRAGRASGSPVGLAVGRDRAWAPAPDRSARRRGRDRPRRGPCRTSRRRRRSARPGRRSAGHCRR